MVKENCKPLDNLRYEIITMTTIAMHSVLKYVLEVSIKERTENRGWLVDLLHRPLLFTRNILFLKTDTDYLILF